MSRRSYTKCTLTSRDGGRCKALTSCLDVKVGVPFSSPIVRVLPAWLEFFVVCACTLLTVFVWVADPGRQFDLVASHIQSLRRVPGFGDSRVIIYVERNLGFEAGA